MSTFAFSRSPYRGLFRFFETKRGKSGHHSAVQRVTPVRRKMRTSATESKYSSAVVKPGKLYTVKRHVDRCLRAARSNRRVGG